MTRLVLLLVVPFVILTAFAVADEEAVQTDREDARVLPIPKEEGVFHFVIFGDRTGGPAKGIEVLTEAVGDANLLDPDLVMTVGDMVQGYCGEAKWLAQMRQYKSVMKGLRMPWYPVPGNHDVYWRGSAPPPGQHEKTFEEHFGPLWYWFPHKNAAFIVLYTDEREPTTGEMGYGRPELNKFSDRQLGWLAKTMEETKAFDHVFLFMHHPRWIMEFYEGSNWDKAHDVLVEAGNVTAVFGGHIHRQRYDGLKDGIEYFTLSTTGGGIPFDSPGTGFLHHMNMVTVRDDRISVTTVPIGAVLDPKAMTPEVLADIDKARSLPVKVAGDLLGVGADGSATGRLTYSIENPAERPVEVTVTCTAGEDWRIGLDHAHLVLAPGESGAFAFPVERPADDFGKPFSLPLLALTVKYVGEDRLIDLGEQVRPAMLRPQAIEFPAVAASDRSLRLKGGGACLMVPASRFTVPDGPFTIEAWVAPNGARHTGVVAANFDFMLFLNGGVPVFGFDIGKGTTMVQGDPNAPLTPKKWRHLAGVFDGAEARLYLDGRLVAKTAAAGKQPRAGVPLCVGAQIDTAHSRAHFFNGRIDDLRLSRVARYAGDVVEAPSRLEPDDDTLLLLRFDTPVGPFTPDRSQSGAHACRTGAVLYTEGRASGE